MTTCDVRGATGDVRCAVPRAVCGACTPHVSRPVARRTSHRTSHIARRTSHVIATAAIALIFGSSSLLACPVCFGAEETSMIDGAKLGILVLLVITLSVQGAFVAFFLYLRRRAKRIAEIDLDTEWSELQGASRTS